MKPFEPTPSRLERARREGDHPISRDAIAVAAFAGALLALWAMGEFTMVSLHDGLRASLDGAGMVRLAFPLAIVAATTAICGGVAATLATLLQTRGLCLRMPATRLSFGRTFSRETLAGTIRCTAVVAAASAAIALEVEPHAEAILKTLAAVTVVGFGGAVLDVFAVRAAWRRRLRMTHDELRRDLREHDGDPQTRGRRRRLHRTLLRGAVREVRRASFVIVNPTHVAVALRYAPPQTPVPEILVRAADAKARKVRALAVQSSIPLIEDPPLARLLYARDALGPIPTETYVAVAQIVAHLQRRA